MPLQATTWLHWNGSAGPSPQYVSTAADWNEKFVPGEHDVAMVVNGGTAYIRTGSDFGKARLDELWAGNGDGWGYGSGNIVQQSGTVRVYYWFQVGRANAPNTSSYDMQGGTIDGASGGSYSGVRIGDGSTAWMKMSNNASITLHDWTFFDIGVNAHSNGTLTMANSSVLSLVNSADFGVGVDDPTANGHFIMGTAAGDTPSLTCHGWVSVGSHGTGMVTINEGTFNHTSATGPLFIGRCGGTGTWTQNGGSTIDSYGTYLGEASTSDSWAGKGTLNLNGGTFATPWISVWNWWNNQNAATMNINFNGGTLVALASNSNYINNNGHLNPDGSVAGGSGLATLNAAVLAGGAIIDTNGFAIGISVPLVSGVTAGTDGGLTKIGLGTLTLSGINTYTGTTAINGGVLSIRRHLTGDRRRYDCNQPAGYPEQRWRHIQYQQFGNHRDEQSSHQRYRLADQVRFRTLVLSGTNSYSGGTTVSGGSLQGRLAGQHRQ